MHVHFIAVGGAVMHNMALAMNELGYKITGSDDQIFEPSKSRLADKGILPEQFGWYPEKISTDIDAVILGMHAKKDNPELVKAQELGLKIYSFPEYVYENAKDKKRVVIAGSHGKTTITSMVMHVLKYAGLDFDYLVGSQLAGFETMVRITKEAPVIVIEGDEYLTSPLDMRSKFLWYKPHLAVITGIAWDHVNVFPTYEGYVDTFRKFMQSFEKEGVCFITKDDDDLNRLQQELKDKLSIQLYDVHRYKIENEQCYLITPNSEEVAVPVFGKHNMSNLQACYKLCQNLGIEDATFYSAIQSFKGAGKRLELLGENADSKIYIDFAHAPSKLKATINSVKEQYADKQVIAIFELHTFSSLSAGFLEEYKHTTDKADELVIVYNPEAAKHKGMDVFSDTLIEKAFQYNKLTIIKNREMLEQYLADLVIKNTVLLLMSSGNLFNLPVNDITKSKL